MTNKNYFVGDKYVNEIVEFPPEDRTGGMPVIDADGTEIEVRPEEFDYLGRPESDMMHFKPEDLEEGEI